MVIWRVANGKESTSAASLPHSSILFDGNLIIFICHICPSELVFPSEVVGLEDIIPPSPSLLQSWLCFQESIGIVVCYEGKL